MKLQRIPPGLDVKPLPPQPGVADDHVRAYIAVVDGDVGLPRGLDRAARIRLRIDLHQQARHSLSPWK